MVGRAALQRLVLEDVRLELPVDGAAEVVHRMSPRDCPLRRRPSVARSRVLCRISRIPNVVFVDFALSRTRRSLDLAVMSRTSVAAALAGRATVWRPSSVGIGSGNSRRAWAPRVSSRASAQAATRRASGWGSPSSGARSSAVRSRPAGATRPRGSRGWAARPASPRRAGAGCAAAPARRGPRARRGGRRRSTR